LGDALALISGILLALYSVFLRMMKNTNSQDAALMGHVIVAVVGLPFVFLYPPSLEVTPIFAMIFMGVMQAGVSTSLYAYGTKRVSAVQSMLIASAEPILNPIWVLLIIGEKPSLQALIGGSLIIIAVVSSSLIGKRREEDLTQRRREKLG
jgi:drug/metabolite transporter (DMT)-like permease